MYTHYTTDHTNNIVMDQNPNFLSESDEKCRRYQMKALYSKLCSLLPNQSSKEVVSLSEMLNEATKCIKMLQEKLEAMKRKKKNLLRKRKSAELRLSGGGETKVPRIEVNARAATLDVVLITGFQHQYMFKETVRILHEEGADVASATLSLVDHNVFHTFYCQIGGRRLENEATRISERLRKSVGVDK